MLDVAWPQYLVRPLFAVSSVLASPACRIQLSHCDPVKMSSSPACFWLERPRQSVHSPDPTFRPACFPWKVHHAQKEKNGDS